MSLFQHIYPSLRYYWKSHLAVIAGIIISSMVLTGTLIVGDSIKTSLEKTALLRLGETEYLFSGIDRYFRASLANDLRETLDVNIAPLLQLNGIASAQGGKYKMNGIQVLGIDENFNSFIPGSKDYTQPPENEAYISENLAQRLQLKTGDSFLLRIEKASEIPKNAPFISGANNYVSLRLKVGKVLNARELGRFNLRTSQTAPYNVFLSLTYLNDKMEFTNKANRILFSGNSKTDQEKLDDAIRNVWTTEDMSLEIYPLEDGRSWEVRSDRIFMDAFITKAVKEIDPGAREILTYMANTFRVGEKETPYSFISAGPFLKNGFISNKDIIINTWLADDLEASVNDSIEISYYVIGPLRKLTEERTWFNIVEIVPIEGIYAEKDLMPDIPGLADAGSCREWEAGIPVALDRIRDKDEDYWNQFRGTPKAFIHYEEGKELWENRFGVCTAIRLSGDDLGQKLINDRLSKVILPSNLGFSVKPVKKEGLTAASGGVDFSQLFMGLSFFLLVAGLVLMALLFNLHLERRKVEIGTLKALGFTLKLIRNLVFVEGLFIAIPGVLIGGLFAILYNKLIFKALNTIWYDIVRTSILQEDVQVISVLIGMGISFALVLITMWFNVRKKFRISASDLQRKGPVAVPLKSKYMKYGGGVSGLLAAGLLIYELLFGKSLNTGIFFIAGTLLLLAIILWIAYRLRERNFEGSENFSYRALIQSNLFLNRARSLRIIILFSLGTFVIISTGLNRKDLHSGADLPTSGTGGFLFFMETTLPILNDLNTTENQSELGFEQPLKFVQLRKNEGDDASCLNLNRVTSARILGVSPGKLNGRFSFIKSSPDLDQSDPWKSLEGKLDGDIIPAIADQTVIQWGLGKQVGDTLVYLDEFGKEMKLKLIGGLANSIFQGNILIDENLFLEHYPSNSGTHVLLVDGSFEKKDLIATELSRAFRNEGIEMESTADRLDTFNQIENTYLSIFLLLGGLAMILGTIGLGVVLVRNIMDREQEIGIMQAIGYKKKDILNLITLEHLFLLLIGTLSGTITAFTAITPSLVSEFVKASWQTALIIIVVILLNGFIWILLISRRILNRNLYYSLRTE